MRLPRARRSGDSTAARRRPGARVLLGVVYVLMVVLGVLLVRGAVHERAITGPVARGVTTTGIVVSERLYEGHEGTHYAPVIEFEAEGRRWVFAAAYTPDAPELGSHVDVSYQRGDPALAHDLSESGVDWVGRMIGGLLLLALAVMGVVRTLRPRRRRRAAGRGEPEQRVFSGRTVRRRSPGRSLMR